MIEPVRGRFLGLCVIVIGMAGCHTMTPSPSGTSTPPVPTPAPSAVGPTADLMIMVDRGTGAPASSWRLVCDPAGGTHPDPVGGCQALEVNGADALPPVAKDQACTMVYGGPEQATITGTWNGQKVSATFSRTNGCEINRWSQMVPLLPEPTS